MKRQEGVCKSCRRSGEQRIDLTRSEKISKSKHLFLLQKLSKIKFFTTCISPLCNLTINQVLSQTCQLLRRSCGQCINPFWCEDLTRSEKISKSKHLFLLQKLSKIKFFTTCISPLCNLTINQVLSQTCQLLRRSCGQCINPFWCEK